MSLIWLALIKMPGFQEPFYSHLSKFAWTVHLRLFLTADKRGVDMPSLLKPDTFTQSMPYLQFACEIEKSWQSFWHNNLQYTFQVMCTFKELERDGSCQRSDTNFASLRPTQLHVKANPHCYSSKGEMALSTLLHTMIFYRLLVKTPISHLL